MPLLLVVDLVHVDVDGGHVLVATLDPGVLSGREGGATAAPSAGFFRNLRSADDGIYLAATSGPLPKMLHLLHQVVAGHVGEDREPVDIRAGLEEEMGEGG